MLREGVVKMCPEQVSGEDLAPPGLPRKLLIGVSGSVAILSLPSYVQTLRAAGVVQIAAVATYTALEFLPVMTMRLLFDAVYTDADHGPGHVALGRWADDVVLLPATAHLLGCLAAGTAPNLVTATVMAAPAPVVLVPAMNQVMWEKPAVRRAVAQVRDDGNTVLDPLPGMAWEVASRSVRPSLVMQPPDRLVAVLEARAGTLGRKDPTSPSA